MVFENFIKELKKIGTEKIERALTHHFFGSKKTLY